VASRLSGRWLPVTAVVVTVGLSTAAAATTPFTPGAEATVVAGFLAVLAALPLRTSAGVGAVVEHDVTAGTAGTAGAAGPTEDGPGRGWRWVVVVAPLVAVAAWELLCFAHGDRAAWPTLSSLLDDVDGSPLGRAATCAVWLGLGWTLVTR